VALVNEGLGSWPARRAQLSPQNPALVFEGATISYAEVNAQVNRLAQVLHDLGLGPGDRVAYLGPNHPALLETLFAAGLLGAVFVPLNTRLVPAEIGYQLADSGASVLIWAPEQAAVVEALGPLPGIQAVSTVDRGAPGDPDDPSVPGLASRCAQASAEPRPPVDVALDDLAMIMYTSGTTGSPKGAMLTHGNLTWNCVNLLIGLDLISDEIALVNAPMFHTAALNHTALPVFLKGGLNVLVPGFDAEQALGLIAEHRITLIFGVTTMFARIAGSPRWLTAELSSLRILHCGGAPIPEALIRTYQQRGLTFVQGYGLTEASPGLTLLRPDQSVAKLGSAGTRMFFTDVQVVHPDLSPVAAGETGEVIARGPNVMAGYWNRPDDTAEALAGGWLHTGDVARIDGDGYVFIVDRIKDMIISGGENIYPAEVEQALYEHPAVQECAIFGVPDPEWGEVGRAVVVLRPGSDAEPDELLAFLGDRVAKYKRPRTLVVVPELPHSAAGKLQRNVIRQRFGPEPAPGSDVGSSGDVGSGGDVVSIVDAESSTVAAVPSGTAVSWPASLILDWQDDIAIVRLNRPAKRNALDDVTVLGLEALFTELPERTRAVVLHAEGEHFSAGLDLSELTRRDAAAGLEHSRMWHRVFERIERGRIPVISVLKGAVIGGGWELACATHLRVAERSAFYGLPEGRHGLFVGGGGSVRIPRLIGAHRMADLMLTGRVLDATEGQALGLSTYLVEPGAGLARALELAGKVAANAPLTNWAVLQALPRIAQANPDEGYLLESLTAAVAGSSDEAQARMRAFLAGRSGKVQRP
jgi:fatty-acyl-CoA synthase